VVHGTDDRLVPIAHSRHTADLIPGAELRIMAGRGHLTVGEELPSLTAEVLGIRPLRVAPRENA
jgi:pimeloyl-ACP methyl ester carboxylesterase